MPHLPESLPPSFQEEQLLLADSISPSSQEEQQNNTNHDFNSEEEANRAPVDNNIENYNNYRCSIVPGVNNDAGGVVRNVDGDPPTGSECEQIIKGEAITITKVLAGTDVKEKDNTVIVATESDTYIKIIGYNCGYYYDCDYWREYDIPGENMEITPGARLASESHLSPCKALLRAGDFVFTGQPPGG